MPRAQKVVIDGIKFDSITEGERYKHLRDCERKGIIQQLEARKEALKFQLQAGVSFPKNPLRPKKPRQSAITYTPDFLYCVNGVMVAEDFKGAYGKSKKNVRLKRVGDPIVTDAARLRHKLFQAQNPHIVFRLVTIETLDPTSTEGYF